MAKKTVRLPKTDSRFWTSKVFRRGSGYSIRFQHAGKEIWLALGKSIKEDAVQEAAAFFKRVEAIGLDSALEERRPKKNPSTVAGLVAAAEVATKGNVRPETLRGYESALRRIAADVKGIKATAATRFSPKGEWKRKTDDIRLELLTREEVQAWVDRSRKTMEDESVRQFIRNAAAIWTCKNSPKLDVELPPNPFVGLRLPKRTDTRYKSNIDAPALLQKALTELPRDEKLTVVLALACGLRRREIDDLRWSCVFADKVEVRPSETYGLKSDKSSGSVPLDPGISALIAACRGAVLPSAFVIEATTPGKRCGRTLYRTGSVQENVIRWLRANGVDTPNPIHTLRKECGNLVAARGGIWAASQLLRHSSVKTTEAHYVTHNATVTSGLGDIIPFKKAKQSKKKKQASA